MHDILSFDQFVAKYMTMLGLRHDLLNLAGAKQEHKVTDEKKLNRVDTTRKANSQKRSES